MFSKKKKSSCIFSLKFFTFRAKIPVFSKKKSSSPRISSYLSISAPNVFSNLAELFFVTFIIARKLEIVAGPYQNLKWVADWTPLV